MTGFPTRYEDVALRLLSNGWPPVPLEPQTKQARVKGWNLRTAAWAATDDARQQVEDEGGLPGGRHSHWGAGIVVRPDMLTVDIDVMHPEAAAKLIEVARRDLGDTPLIRVGRAPKALLVYRALPFSILSGHWWSLDWQSTGSLINGRRSAGGQFAAFAWHGGAGKPYEWTAGASPLDMRPDDPAIPLVTADRWGAYKEKVRPVLVALGAEAERLEAARQGRQPEITVGRLGLDPRARLDACLAECGGDPVEGAARYLQTARAPSEGFGGNCHATRLVTQGYLRELGAGWDVTADFIRRHMAGVTTRENIDRDLETMQKYWTRGADQ
jgi:hypothetical protein